MFLAKGSLSTSASKVAAVTVAAQQNFAAVRLWTHIYDHDLDVGTLGGILRHGGETGKVLPTPPLLLQKAYFIGNDYLAIIPAPR